MVVCRLAAGGRESKTKGGKLYDKNGNRNRSTNFYDRTVVDIFCDDCRINSRIEVKQKFQLIYFSSACFCSLPRLRYQDFVFPQPVNVLRAEMRTKYDKTIIV